MSTIKLTRIISCSSEDPKFPANNLTQESRFLKWRCQSHEPEICAIIQLEKSTKIHGLDIGNENSAFIEVLVGRSAGPDTFHTLLGASAFMSPSDSKNESNGNQVRMFSYEHLTKPHVDESWDRIKIVCCQPFNRTIQYGLSFIKLTSPEIIQSQSPNTLGKFLLKENQDSSIKIGSIFARHKNKQVTTVPTGAAAIREANQNILNYSYDDQPTPGTSKMQTPNKNENIIKKVADKVGDDIQTPLTSSDTLKKTPKTPKAYPKPIINPIKQHTIKKPETENNSSKGIKRSQDQPLVKKKPKNTSKPFYQLLEDVVIVISGIQNPERSNLRSKALEMGAKYKADWDKQSTHLICAFANTPKFNQVKGKGKIVRRQWIEECYNKRKKLPWRRFALDNVDKHKPESEDEINEKVSEDESDDIDFSFTDSDDMINTIDVIDPFDIETEDEINIETEDTTIPDLIDLFSNLTFFISDYDDKKITDIKRLIIGFKGKITNDISSATYVISASDNKDKDDNNFINGDWIWKCCMDKTLHPIEHYKL